MRVVPGIMLLVGSVSAQVGPYGVPFDRKGTFGIKGRLFVERASQVIGAEQAVTFESCIFRPNTGFAAIRVLGKAEFRNCLFWVTPGAALLAVSAGEAGSVVFQDCILSGSLSFSIGREFSDLTWTGAEKMGGSILFNRCRFEMPPKPRWGPHIGTSVDLRGFGISFRACDFDLEELTALGGTEGPAPPPLGETKGKDAKTKDKKTKDTKRPASQPENVVDARNCWWGTTDVMEVQSKIKDQASGHTAFSSGYRSTITVVVVPLAKAPFTTMLKPPGEKTRAEEEPAEKK